MITKELEGSSDGIRVGVIRIPTDKYAVDQATLSSKKFRVATYVR